MGFVGAAADDALLDELWRRVGVAWPGLALDRGAFVAHLARHTPADAPAAYLAGVHVEDLALACACARHDPVALRELEARYFAGIVPRAIARVAAAPIDEVLQRLRERLLVGGRAGVAGKIADYSGRGPLAAWLRAAAVRTAINLLRQQQAHATYAAADDELPAAAAHGDPEIHLLRARHADAFQGALQRAFDALPVRERNLLRLSYVDRLSIDEIGGLYGVHRATASRWIAGARATILGEIRRDLAARLAATDSELESLMRALRSQLELSLRLVTAR